LGGSKGREELEKTLWKPTSQSLDLLCAGPTKTTTASWRFHPCRWFASGFVPRSKTSQPGRRAAALAAVWIAATGCEADLNHYDPEEALRTYRLIESELRAELRISLGRAITNEPHAATRITMIQMLEHLEELEAAAVAPRPARRRRRR
jgi:hypothetical protein